MPTAQRKKTDTIITFTEAAEQIGKCRQTVWRWANDGLIPEVTHPSGGRGIWQSDFDRLYGASKLRPKPKSWKPQTGFPCSKFGCTSQATQWVGHDAKNGVYACEVHVVDVIELGDICRPLPPVN